MEAPDSAVSRRCWSALPCLTACGRKESTDGRASLSVCVGETPATYDPIYAQRIGDQTILNHLYENLMRLETGENSQTASQSTVPPKAWT